MKARLTDIFHFLVDGLEFMTFSSPGVVLTSHFVDMDNSLMFCHRHGKYMTTDADNKEIEQTKRSNTKNYRTLV